MTENQKKPPPCPLREGECSDGKGGMWWRKKRGVAIIRGRQDEGMIFG